MREPLLSRSAVDRDAQLREDDAALAAAWERARVLVVSDGSALVDGSDLVLLDPDEAPDGDRLYLGTDGATAYFAVAAPLPRRLGARALGLRESGALLGRRDAGLLVHAVALTNWHATHTRCSRCGSTTTPAKGGSVRRCEADGSEHFPRTDPAVIVLVSDGGDRCLLGRQASWPPRRYSTLAGFVEPGESAEAAVVREVEEESGVRVRDVAYRGSQPWPFPASLMLGFRAVADPGAAAVARDAELEDAAWFTRRDLRDEVVLLPPAVSIAHALILEWLDEG